MEEAIAQLADDRDEIEAHRDSAVLHEEELQSRVAELEQHLEQTQEKLQVGEALCISCYAALCSIDVCMNCTPYVEDCDESKIPCCMKHNGTLSSSLPSSC